MSTKRLQIIGGLGSNLELDTTLTQEGKAADAKSVGDALATKQPVGNYADASVLEALQTKVGDKTVSEQIESAISDIDYPVDSINGKTGDVILTASDVGAYTKAEINDMEFITVDDIDAICGTTIEYVSLDDEVSF